MVKPWYNLGHKDYYHCIITEELIVPWYGPFPGDPVSLRFRDYVPAGWLEVTYSTIFDISPELMTNVTPNQE